MTSSSTQETEPLPSTSLHPARPTPPPRTTQQQQDSRYNARPEQVREFFRHVLTHNHDVSIEEADAIAAKWMYGRGSELLHYDIDTYRGIFGVEAGSLLYAYGHERLWFGANIRMPPCQGYQGHPLRWPATFAAALLIYMIEDGIARVTHRSGNELITWATVILVGYCTNQVLLRVT